LIAQELEMEHVLVNQDLLHLLVAIVHLIYLDLFASNVQLVIKERVTMEEMELEHVIVVKDLWVLYVINVYLVKQVVLVLLIVVPLVIL